MTKWENDDEIQRFREYLKIPSVQPDVNYDDCVKFLKRQADELGLPIAVYEVVSRKPTVIITWEGRQPHLPSILLNSHMDVVPVTESQWTYPPFDAHVTEDGDIYARGIQDMKCVGMMHLESVRRLKPKYGKLNRTIHICFSPDEEIGSADGMKAFAESPHFKNLNIGFALDESGPNVKPDEIYLFYGERTSTQIKVTCKGRPGHGSLLLRNTAGEKIHSVMDKFLKYRQQEVAKMRSGTPMGDVTSINITKLEGGLHGNIIPDSLTVLFDIRITPSVDQKEFEAMIAKWCRESGDDIHYEYVMKNPAVKNSKLDDNPIWQSLKHAVERFNLKLNCLVCPGATDARFVRQHGIPAVGFTPIVNTPLLVHDDNERMNAIQYKKGIDVMEAVVAAIANTTWYSNL